MSLIQAVSNDLCDFLCWFIIFPLIIWSDNSRGRRQMSNAKCREGRDNNDTPTHKCSSMAAIAFTLMMYEYWHSAAYYPLPKLCDVYICHDLWFMRSAGFLITNIIHCQRNFAIIQLYLLSFVSLKCVHVSCTYRIQDIQKEKFNIFLRHNVNDQSFTWIVVHAISPE